MGLPPFLRSLFIYVVFAGFIRDVVISASASNADGSGLLSEEKFHLEEMSSSMDFSAMLCDSCLEISKNSKTLLLDSSLSNEIGNTGKIFCRLMPSDSEKKCEMILKMYEQKGPMLFQELFHDENFCVNKGFCSGNSQTESVKTAGQTQVLRIGERLNDVLSQFQGGLPVNVANTVFNSTASLTNQNSTIELKSNGSCAACRNILDKIRVQLEDPNKQIKLISAIIKACETEIFVSQCKKMIYAYGPIIVTNLQKVVSLDLCHTVHLCDSPRNQTTQKLIDGMNNRVLDIRGLVNEIQ